MQNHLEVLQKLDRKLDYLTASTNIDWEIFWLFFSVMNLGSQWVNLGLDKGSKTEDIVLALSYPL